jgi:outer membrane protein OmpA-like peptidoglycan-associated protein
MFKGKKTCEVLRAVRKRVADLNGIQYVPVECTHEGDCIGTCPACERERQYVEEQLSLRAMAGHTLKVVGVAAGLTSMLSGQEAQAQEMIQERDTIQQKFKWDSYCFDFGARPKPEDMVQWDEMAAFISKFPEDTFLVVGHTDERGSEKYNLKLSEVRAEYLRKLLVERGVDPQRIMAIGVGPKECVIRNARTEFEHEQNRRVTLEFCTPERVKAIIKSIRKKKFLRRKGRW